MTVTLTLWHILGAMVALAGGAGTLGALVAAGVARRYIEPIVRSELARFEGEPSTVAARRAATLQVVEDHLRRDDGLIRQRLDAQDDRLRGALEELHRTVTAELRETREHLARIEGLLAHTHPTVSRADG